MLRGVVAMVPMGLSKHGKEAPYSWRLLCGTQVLLFNKGDGDRRPRKLIRIDMALIRAQSGTAFLFQIRHHCCPARPWTANSRGNLSRPPCLTLTVAAIRRKTGTSRSAAFFHES